MATLVFHSNFVEEEELIEVRQLLVEHEIEFHETGAGLLALGKAGLWVDTAQAETARQLIEHYQQQRQQTVSQQYLDHPKTLWRMFYQQPLKWVFNMLIIGCVLSLCLLPFYYFFH